VCLLILARNNWVIIRFCDCDKELIRSCERADFVHLYTHRKVVVQKLLQSSNAVLGTNLQNVRFLYIYDRCVVLTGKRHWQIFHRMSESSSRLMDSNNIFISSSRNTTWLDKQRQYYLTSLTVAAATTTTASKLTPPLRRILFDIFHYVFVFLFKLDDSLFMSARPLCRWYLFLAEQWRTVQIIKN